MAFDLLTQTAVASLPLISCPELAESQTIAEALSHFSSSQSHIPGFVLRCSMGHLAGFVGRDELLRCLAQDQNAHKPLAECARQGQKALPSTTSLADVIGYLRSELATEVVITEENKCLGILDHRTLNTWLLEKFDEELKRVDREASEGAEQFVSHVAHDLRNPLSIIASCCDMLQRAVDWNPQHSRYCEMIRRSAIRALQLSDSLLQLERYANGNSLQLKEIDVASFVGEIEAQATSMAAQRDQTVVVESCDHGSFQIDHLLMTRALENLIDNACKHSPRGGIVYLSVKRRWEGAEEFLDLAVRDEGSGLNTQQADIFAPFVRLNESTSIAGYGLGLTIAKRFSELHGGSIRAVGGPNEQGAEFIISIPSQPSFHGHQEQARQQTRNDGRPDHPAPVNHCSARQAKAARRAEDHSL